MFSPESSVCQLISSYSHPSEQTFESVIQTIVSKVSNVDSSSTTTSLGVITTQYPTFPGYHPSPSSTYWTPIRHTVVPHVQQRLPNATSVVVTAPPPSIHEPQQHSSGSESRTLRILPRLLRVGGVFVDRAEWVTHATRDCLNSGHLPYLPLSSSSRDNSVILPMLDTIGSPSRAIIDPQLPQKTYNTPQPDTTPSPPSQPPIITSTLALFIPPTPASTQSATSTKSRPTPTHPSSIPLPLSLLPLSAVESALSSHTHSHPSQSSQSSPQSPDRVPHPRLCLCCARHEWSPITHAFTHTLPRVEASPIASAPPASSRATSTTTTAAADSTAACESNESNRQHLGTGASSGKRPSLNSGAWVRAPGPVAGVRVCIWAHVGDAAVCVEEWRVALRTEDGMTGLNGNGESVAMLRALIAAAAKRAEASMQEAVVGHFVNGDTNPGLEAEDKDAMSLAALLRSDSDDAAASQETVSPNAETKSSKNSGSGTNPSPLQTTLTAILRSLPATPSEPILAPTTVKPKHTALAPPALGLASVLRAIGTVAGGTLPVLSAAAAAMHVHAWSSISVQPLLSCMDTRTQTRTDSTSNGQDEAQIWMDDSLPLSATWRVPVPVKESLHAAAHIIPELSNPENPEIPIPAPYKHHLATRDTSLQLCIELRRHPHPQRSLLYKLSSEVKPQPLLYRHAPSKLRDISEHQRRWELSRTALADACARLEQLSQTLLNLPDSVTTTVAAPSVVVAESTKPMSLMTPRSPTPVTPTLTTTSSTATAGAAHTLAMAALFGGLPSWLTSNNNHQALHQTLHNQGIQNTHTETETRSESALAWREWHDALAAVQSHIHRSQDILHEAFAAHAALSAQTLALVTGVAARGWRGVTVGEAWASMGAAGVIAVRVLGDGAQKKIVREIAAGGNMGVDPELLDAARKAVYLSRESVLSTPELDDESPEYFADTQSPAAHSTLNVAESGMPANELSAIATDPTGLTSHTDTDTDTQAPLTLHSPLTPLAVAPAVPLSPSVASDTLDTASDTISLDSDDSLSSITTISVGSIAATALSIAEDRALAVHSPLLEPPSSLMAFKSMPALHLAAQTQEIIPDADAGAPSVNIPMTRTLTDGAQGQGVVAASTSYSTTVNGEDVMNGGGADAARGSQDIDDTLDVTIPVSGTQSQVPDAAAVATAPEVATAAEVAGTDASGRRVAEEPMSVAKVTRVDESALPALPVASVVVPKGRSDGFKGLYIDDLAVDDFDIGIVNPVGVPAGNGTAHPTHLDPAAIDALSVDDIAVDSTANPNINPLATAIATTATDLALPASPAPPLPLPTANIPSATSIASAAYATPPLASTAPMEDPLAVSLAAEDTHVTVPVPASPPAADTTPSSPRGGGDVDGATMPQTPSHGLPRTPSCLVSVSHPRLLSALSTALSTGYSSSPSPSSGADVAGIPLSPTPGAAPAFASPTSPTSTHALNTMYTAASTAVVAGIVGGMGNGVAIDGSAPQLASPSSLRACAATPKSPESRKLTISRDFSRKISDQAHGSVVPIAGTPMYWDSIDVVPSDRDSDMLSLSPAAPNYCGNNVADLDDVAVLGNSGSINHDELHDRPSSSEAHLSQSGSKELQNSFEERLLETTEDDEKVTDDNSYTILRDIAQTRSIQFAEHILRHSATGGMEDDYISLTLHVSDVEAIALVLGDENLVTRKMVSNGETFDPVRMWRLVATEHDEKHVHIGGNTEEKIVSAITVGVDVASIHENTRINYEELHAQLSSEAKEAIQWLPFHAMLFF